MEKQPTPLERAALLRDKAKRALRLAAGLSDADHRRLTQFGESLREEADELERQAASEGPHRPPDPAKDDAKIVQGLPKKGRGGSNDPEPQS